jgi:hypothetical protein
MVQPARRVFAASTDARMSDFEGIAEQMLGMWSVERVQQPDRTGSAALHALDENAPVLLEHGDLPAGREPEILLPATRDRRIDFDGVDLRCGQDLRSAPGNVPPPSR